MQRTYTNINNVTQNIDKFQNIRQDLLLEIDSELHIEGCNCKDKTKKCVAAGCKICCNLHHDQSELELSVNPN